MTPEAQQAHQEPALGVANASIGTWLVCPCGRRFRKRREKQAHCQPSCRNREWRKTHPRVPIGQVLLAFDPPGEPVPGVNRSVAPQARERLQAAARRILARLREAPATNAELLKIGGLRYGARLGEIREHLRWLHGKPRQWDPIKCDENKATGLAIYTLDEAAL